MKYEKDAVGFLHSLYSMYTDYLSRDREQLIVLQYYCNTIAIVLYWGEGR